MRHDFRITDERPRCSATSHLGLFLCLFAAKFGPQAALLHFDVYYSKRVNFIRGGVTSCYLTGSFLRFYERMLLQKEDGAGR